MNDLSPGRIIMLGKNSALSATAIQDAVGAEPGDEEPMELYTAYIYARQAGEHLLTAHILRRRGDTIGADHHHTLAMQQLDELAETIGLELVPQHDPSVEALSESGRAGGLDPLPSSSGTSKSHQAGPDAPAAADNRARLPGDAQ